MRKLGIIGGTSWSSTALYYEHINRGVAQRLGGLHSARLTIESLDFAEMAAMQLTGDWDAHRASFTSMPAKRLVAAGAEGMLITCNTTHKIYDAVAPRFGVPMLHIGDAAADRLVADGRKPGGSPRDAVHDDRTVHPQPRIEGRGITDRADRRAVDRARSTGSSSRSSPPAGSSATASASSRP